MKVMNITSTAVLCLLLGIAAPVHAQNEHQGEKQNHPGQQQSKPEQASPQQHAQKQKQQADQNNQQQHAQQQQHRAEQAAACSAAAARAAATSSNSTLGSNSAQQQRKQQQHARQQQPQPLSKSGTSNRRPGISIAPVTGSPSTAIGSNAAVTTATVFLTTTTALLWSRSPFRVYGQPFMVVGGYPRFQYGGYWISTVDPCPEYWPNDWYDTDDVYVTYVDNGYYLYNRRYPDVGIAISISL